MLIRFIEEKKEFPDFSKTIIKELKLCCDWMDTHYRSFQFVPKEDGKGEGVLMDDHGISMTDLKYCPGCGAEFKFEKIEEPRTIPSNEYVLRCKKCEKVLPPLEKGESFCKDGYLCRDCWKIEKGFPLGQGLERGPG